MSEHREFPNPWQAARALQPAWKARNAKKALQFLGDVPPYPITTDDWESLRDALHEVRDHAAAELTPEELTTVHQLIVQVEKGMFRIS